MIKKKVPDYILRIYGFMHMFFSNFYRFDPKKYRGLFICKNSALSHNSKKADAIIYCFWTGLNKMSDNRLKSLAELISNAQIPVKLITPNNLDQYIKEPLHPAYPLLSNVHKSDYLRCYFMHHWGGGYSDIKAHHNSWQSALKNLNSKENKIAAGYREFYWGSCTIESHFSNTSTKNLNKDLNLHYAYLLGNGSFIFKPYSAFTEEWINELHHRLDLHFAELKENPGNIYGDNPGYPLPWTYILGQIFHPLCLKYHHKLIIDDDLLPQLKNYR